MLTQHRIDSIGIGFADRLGPATVSTDRDLTGRITLDVARGLGLNIGAHRLLGLATITLLTGAATAACGPIAFVGLVAPHVARALVGADYRWLIPASAGTGAALLVASDVVGRVLVRPAELQVGIVVALIGAPFFVALIRRRTPAAL